MKKTLLTFLIVTLISFANSSPALADSWFDSYGRIPWEEEKSRLDNFAHHLELNPDMIGYIAFYAGRKDRASQNERVVARAKEYLINRRKVDKKRIVIINAGKKAEFKIVLQPVSRHLPIPRF